MTLQDHLADPKFRSYITNIEAKTGKGPDDFIRLARKKGFLEPGVKAGPTACRRLGARHRRLTYRSWFPPASVCFSRGQLILGVGRAR